MGRTYPIYLVQILYWDSLLGPSSLWLCKWPVIPKILQEAPFEPVSGNHGIIGMIPAQPCLLPGRLVIHKCGANAAIVGCPPGKGQYVRNLQYHQLSTLSCTLGLSCSLPLLLPHGLQSGSRGSECGVSGSCAWKHCAPEISGISRVALP